MRYGLSSAATPTVTLVVCPAVVVAYELHGISMSNEVRMFLDEF
jgi:hypothetical protein